MAVVTYAGYLLGCDGPMCPGSQVLAHSIIRSVFQPWDQQFKSLDTGSVMDVMLQHMGEGECPWQACKSEACAEHSVTACIHQSGVQGHDSAQQVWHLFQWQEHIKTPFSDMMLSLCKPSHLTAQILELGEQIHLTHSCLHPTHSLQKYSAHVWNSLNPMKWTGESRFANWNLPMHSWSICLTTQRPLTGECTWVNTFESFWPHFLFTCWGEAHV